MSAARQNDLHSDESLSRGLDRRVMPTADGSFSNPFKVGITGIPSAGKTTLFNAITKARLRTGNYPGVTVEQAEGRLRWGTHWYDLVDLPGTYSLSSQRREEGVVNDFLIEEKPDVVIDVLDSSQLERHLYLAIELLELGVPVVLALNLWDVVLEKGLKIWPG